MLGIELPIVGAGAGSIASPRLAAAVTNAGGLGMTGAAGDSPEQVIDRVREIRTLTSGPVGVNVILEIQPPEAIAAILAEGIDVLATGFGDPGPWLEPARTAGTKVFHRCETPAEARAAARCGVDAVIAQGSDSGGHTGVVPTFTLVPQVVDAAGGTPVLAAGGIADGRGLAGGARAGGGRRPRRHAARRLRGIRGARRLQAADRRGCRGRLDRHRHLRDRLAGPARAGAPERDHGGVGRGA